MFEAILYIQWPCTTRSGLVAGSSYVELEDPSSHVLCCCVLCFSMITILRTRRDATYNTMITLIKTYVSKPLVASNLSPPKRRIHVVSSRPSSIFNGLARHEAGWSWVDHMSRWKAHRHMYCAAVCFVFL